MSKHVFISGANGALGKTVVDSFISNNYHIIGAGHGESNQPQNIQFHNIDLANESSTESFFQTLFQNNIRLECAALLAGGFAMGNLQDTPYSEIEKMLTINFKTVYNVVRPVFTHMCHSGGGSIILIASKAGAEPANGAAMLGYTLSKAILFPLAEALNAEGKAKGVYIHILVPGTIDTFKNREAMPDADFSTWVKPETLAAKMLDICKNPSTNNQSNIHRYY